MRGIINSCVYSPSPYPYKETTVETDQGTFLVRGAFVAIKGHPLVLEMRKDGSRMLCDPAEKTCAQLVR